MKTVATRKRVADFIASIEDPQRRSECKAVMKMMRRVTGKNAVMWGDSIVGYDRYKYTRANGREFEFFRTGFSPRKTALTLYIMPGYTDFSALLKKLGPHKKGKSCLYLKRLSDIDMDVLEELIQAGIDDMNRRYPPA